MAYFTEILLFSFYHRLKILIGIAIFLVIGHIIDSVILHKNYNDARKLHKKDKRRKYKVEFSNKRNAIIFRLCMGLIYLIILFFMWVLPPYKDATHDSIVEIETTYSRKNMTYGRFPTNVGGYITIISKENEIQVMELYPGFLNADFPEGEFHAKVWYGEESDIILKITLLDG